MNARKEALQVSRNVEPAVSALVVGRDSMNSGLLADLLVRDLRYTAAAVLSCELLQVLGTRDIDLVILSADLSGRPGVGFELSKAVSSAHPKIPIVMLLDQPTHQTVIKAFRCGARGVFSRQESMGEFLDCAEHVRKGHIWAGGEETMFLLEALKSLPAPVELTEIDSSTLTKRELQVVQCAATGQTNKAIASELGLSEHTVKNYLFRAFEKLGVSSHIELLFYLTSRGHSFSPRKVEPKEAKAPRETRVAV
jgi:DNA-binding NarL/FixJ family response regulator